MTSPRLNTITVMNFQKINRLSFDAGEHKVSYNEC